MTASPRPMRGWEAIDWGFLLTRRDYFRIVVPWLFLVIPLVIGMGLALPAHPWAVGLLVWWLKPVYDRIGLAVLSRTLFGETPTTSGLLKELPGLLWRSRIIFCLTLARLDIGRSFGLPLIQLEHLPWEPRRKRRQVLSHGLRGAAGWLTFLGYHLEWILVFGTASLLLWFIPTSPVDVENETLNDMIQWFFLEESNLQAWIYTVLYVAVSALFEPFYIGGGFALYLSRRAELEGWDVEQQFRALVARQTSPRRYGAMAACLTAGILALAMISPQAAVAQNGEPDPQAVIEQVLAHEDFGKTETRTTYVPRWDTGADEEQADEPDSDIQLGGVLAAFAQLMELLIWALVIGLIGWLLWYLFKDFQPPRMSEPTAKKGERQVWLADEPVEKGLPADVVRAARAAIAQGNVREALSLLYRGAISHYAHRFDIELRPGATEGDWQRAIRQAAGAPQPYFDQLTLAWLRTAYAHRPPDNQAANQLCDQWLEAHHAE